MRVGGHLICAAAVAALLLSGPPGSRAASGAGAATPAPDARYLDCPMQQAFYVSPRGSDANPGTAQAPFRTIQRAVAAATAAIAGGMTGDIVLFLRGGDYRLDEPLRFGPASSGRNHCKLVLQSHPGEQAVIDGGRRISGWTLYDRDRRIYRADVGRNWSFRQLYVNGRHVRRARRDLAPADLRRTPQGFAVANTAVAADWRDLAGAEAVLLGKWMSIRCTVASAAATAIVMSDPCWKNAQWAAQWGATLPSWLENKYQFLHRPGDWFLDGSSGFLYYVAGQQENIAGEEITAPVAQDLVIGDAAHDLVFRNLQFMLSNWTAPNAADGYVGLQGGYRKAGADGSLTAMHAPIRFSHSRAIVFENNTFRQLGSTALAFDRGSQDIFVLGNRFVGIAGGAMQFGQIDDGGETSPANQSRSYLIRDNYISDVGFEYFDVAAIAGFYVAELVAEHNLIASVPHYGISIGWGWGKDPSYARDNQIGWNYIRDFSQRFADSGAIYTLGSAPGTFVHDNYVADGGRGFCLYPDEGSAYQHWTLNLCEHVKEWLHAWTASIHDNAFTGNFTDTANMELRAPDNEVRNNVVVVDGRLPAAARRIKAEAGSAAAGDRHPSR